MKKKIADIICILFPVVGEGLEDEGDEYEEEEGDEDDDDDDEDVEDEEDDDDEHSDVKKLSSYKISDHRNGDQCKQQ